jgi:TonB family protein
MNAEEKFGRWIGMSIALHVALVAIVVLAPSLLTLRGASNWGSSASGADGINVKISGGISGIPLPQPANVQEKAVANESEGRYNSETEPPAPKPKPREEKVEEKPEVAIPEKNLPKRPEPKPRQVASATPPAPAPDNAVPYGQGGRPSLQYGQFATGAGQAGIQFGDGAFGDSYGWYVEAMRRTISGNWLKALVNTNLKVAPRVYVSFIIARDGNISDFKIEQPSGIPALDNSAQRAILASNPLQALPREYRGSTVEVKLYFEYVR